MSTEVVIFGIVRIAIALAVGWVAGRAYRQILRDYFAAQAMSRIVGSPFPSTIPEWAKGISVGEYIARKAYMLADSMMEHRK
jgi:hypothetical protein